MNLDLLELRYPKGRRWRYSSRDVPRPLKMDQALIKNLRCHVEELIVNVAVGHWSAVLIFQPNKKPQDFSVQRKHLGRRLWHHPRPRGGHRFLGRLKLCRVEKGGFPFEIGGNIPFCCFGIDR